MINPGKYKHYKGQFYEVLGLVTHSETLETLVLYKPLYGETDRLWVRPMDMFCENVEINGSLIPRFEKVNS